MNTDAFFKRLAFLFACLGLALGQTAVAEDDDPEMEEVVVTGSYLSLIHI